MAEKTIKEDIEFDTVDYAGMSLEDLYDEFGIDIFDEENIPALKKAGLINEDGYPMKTEYSYSGQKELVKMSLYEISEMDLNFIKKPYIEKLAIKDLFNEASRHEATVDNDIIVKYHEGKLPNIRDMSRDFLKACFNGDAWDYFDNYYPEYSFNDCEYYIDDIPSEVKDYLESKGFPAEIYQEIKDGVYNTEEGEESIFYDYIEPLKDAFTYAVAEATHDGSASAAVDDFDDAFENSIPDGIFLDKNEWREEERTLRVSEEFIKNNIEEIWEHLDYYDDDLFSSMYDYIIETINEGLEDNFREPYYGWNEFDEESFKDRLLDRILEIELPDLHTTSIETSEEEVEEDLDFDAIDIEKPKKLFYKYKEYNKELSSKAYRLDVARLSSLLAFLYAQDKYDRERYIGEWDLKDLETFYDAGDCDKIILSSIKPSYQTTYGQTGYTIWADRDSYNELDYLGWIPKAVGNNILGNLNEDLEVDIVPIPEFIANLIDEGEINLSDFDEEIIVNRWNEPIWGITAYGLNSIDDIVTDVTLPEAFERYEKAVEGYLDYGDNNENVIISLNYFDDGTYSVLNFNPKYAALEKKRIERLNKEE